MNDLEEQQHCELVCALSEEVCIMFFYGGGARALWSAFDKCRKSDKSDSLTSDRPKRKKEAKETKSVKID